MKHTVRELMHEDPITLEASSTALEASRKMRDAHIGDVLVTDNGKLNGIVTDRDLVVRCMANGDDPAVTSIGSLCSGDLVTLSPDAEAKDAVKLMREKAIRRIPVVEADRAIGILSIGDLAQDRDPSSALSDISSAPPNQ